MVPTCSVRPNQTKHLTLNVDKLIWGIYVCGKMLKNSTFSGVTVEIPNGLSFKEFENKVEEKY